MTDAGVAMTGGPGGTEEAGRVKAGIESTGTGGGAAAGVTAEELGQQLLSAVDVAEAWLEELADQVAVSASEVQDRLLDLWGYLDEGPARVEVERWLTETLRRNLYSVSDINDRLESLLPIS
jgi:hypothetical protein